MSVKSGLEVLRDSGFAALEGLRVGLMTNPSAVDSWVNSTYQIFAEAPEVNLTAIFGAEHGFAGAVPDGEKVASGIDPRTGIPVHSLYGTTRRPTPEMLADVDVIVCDIQDIGVRFYTYTWTVSHILEAAGEYGVEVIVLDRPNPLGGDTIYGSPLEEKFSSFVGRFPVPVQYGMTLGEMARMVNDTWNPFPAELQVIACEELKRSMRFAETGLPWVPTSPNIPQVTTLDHYIGACLIEGTRLSEGRGTALPFEVVGAPWINGMDLADALNDQGWAGVRFRPCTFLPHTSKWAGEYCNGVQVHITEIAEWRPLHAWLGVIQIIARLYPDQFEWLPPYQRGVEFSPQHFDRLIGSEQVRIQLDAGVPVGEITAGWEQFCSNFAAQREPFLLYD